MSSHAMPEKARRESGPQVVVALDYHNLEDALALVESVRHLTSWFKMGCQLFARCGRAAVDALRDKHCEIFVDLKVNGTPRTDFALAQAVAAWDVRLVDIHLTLGEQGVRGFLDGIDRCPSDRPAVLGVTVLTSYSDVPQFGWGATREDTVMRLATMAKRMGLDGVVCAARDVAPIRSALGEDLKLVTPGIRPAGAPHDDQQQVATPTLAVEAGADFLVIGRPITRSADPASELRRVLDEVELASHRRASAGSCESTAPRGARLAL